MLAHMISTEADMFECDYEHGDEHTKLPLKTKYEEVEII